MNNNMRIVVLCAIQFAYLICVCNAASQMSVEATKIGPNRYAILKEYGMSGMRNVRWETMPVNYMDSNGKPVASKIGGTKSADGTTVFGCYDALGKEQAHNAEYQRPNGKFIYKCNNGIEEVLACVGSNRTNKAHIEVGKTLDVDGFWHKCQSFPNSSVVYTEENTCHYNNKNYHIGEEFTAGFLRLECQDGGYKAIGCAYLDENQNRVPLNVGDKREVGKVVHYCEDKGNTIQYFAKANGCTKSGKDYKEGDVFSLNHLHYKCENGLADVTGCYIDEKRELSLGQDVVEKNMVYRCYRLGAKVEYIEYACGMNGTPSCTPEPIPQTPDDAPTLAHGLKAPGFGTFAIAQQVGGSGFQNGGSIQLDLDKLLAAHH